MTSNFRFTDITLAHLRACRAQGLTMREAAREMGVSRDKLRISIIDGGYSEQVRLMYSGFGANRPGAGPKLPNVGKIRRLRPEQIDAPLVTPDNPQTRWLTKAWRVAA